MQINVLQELRQRIGSVVTYEITEPVARIHDISLNDFRGHLTLLRTSGGLLVSLNATASMDEKCARCLAETRCAVSIDFEEEYVPMVDATTGARVRTVDNEDVFRIGPDFVLDLREGLRQYVLMAEPAMPLCRPDCAGLCSGCGVDLNRTSCRCAPRSDGRWAALTSLREKIEGS